jgi:hypothetical protein
VVLKVKAALLVLAGGRQVLVPQQPVELQPVWLPLPWLWLQLLRPSLLPMVRTTR